MDENRVIKLDRLNRLAIKEINRYKWLQSEQAGHDIGDYTAAKEWIVKYYAQWLENQKQE